MAAFTFLKAEKPNFYLQLNRRKHSCKMSAFWLRQAARACTFWTFM